MLVRVCADVLRRRSVWQADSFDNEIDRFEGVSKSKRDQ